MEQVDFPDEVSIALSHVLNYLLDDLGKAVRQNPVSNQDVRTAEAWYRELISARSLDEYP